MGNRRVLAGWLLALSLSLAGCRTRELQTGLSEQEAQEIIVLLAQNHVQAERKREVGGKEGEAAAWTVNVAGGDQTLVSAWRILQHHGLPRQKVKGLEEVFAKSGLIPTAGEERARLMVGLAGQISKTLNSLSGVVYAGVHVSLPENNPLADKKDKTPATAAVLLQYQGPQAPLAEEEVKKLVAHGVEGLQADKVTVVMKRVEVKPLPQTRWYLQSEALLVAAMSVMTLTAIGALALVARAGVQRARILSLQKQLQAALQRPQLTTEGGERG